MKIYNPTIEGEITLPAFPSTRNDGVIPTNKILSTDASGNLKLYSIATAPAPFLDYVVPDSTLPSTTGNFQLHGSFFTPSMCLTANLATSIIFTGQTVNYAIFHSSNWIEVNITTGATEGSFAITLNNGLSATFANAILIVLGTVFKPLTAEWTLTEPIEVDDDKVMVQIYGNQGTAVWSKEFDVTKNISIRAKGVPSPLGTWANNTNWHTYRFNLVSLDGLTIHFSFDIMYSGSYRYDCSSLTESWLNYAGITSVGHSFEFRQVAGIWTFYSDNVARRTFTHTVSENLKLQIIQKHYDFIDIKYIELF
jgi:hypothetical protein